MCFICLKHQSEPNCSYQSLCKSSLLFVLSCLAVHGAPKTNTFLLVKLHAGCRDIRVIEYFCVLPDFTLFSPQFSGRSKNSSSPLLLTVVCRARHWLTALTGLHQDRAARGDVFLVDAKINAHNKMSFRLNLKQLYYATSKMSSPFFQTNKLIWVTAGLWQPMTFSYYLLIYRLFLLD